ncbi:rhodanese-like domain-containing protein [bacterium]|jgi:rhodanese-related sulfurtransferase|nr:rhodanese-like domain-containing protein [bacterium]
MIKLKSISAIFFFGTVMCLTSILSAFDLESEVIHIKKKYPAVKHVTQKDFLKWKNNPSSNITIFDVREKKEYDISHIENAIYLRPNSSINKVSKSLNKNQKIIVYCSVGYRSAEMAKQLMRVGFTNVYNLEGALFEWANSGNHLYRNEKKVSTIHPYNKKWGTLLNADINKEYHPGKTK